METNFWNDCPVVERVPGKLNGKPIVKGSRVAADTIPECAELGETAEDTAANYGLRLEEVLEILAYYKARRDHPALAF